MNKITRQYDENGMNIYGLHSIIKAIDGCKDAKGLNLYQFQNNSWLYGKTFITISKLRLHFYKQIDIQSNLTL